MWNHNNINNCIYIETKIDDTEVIITCNPTKKQKIKQKNKGKQTNKQTKTATEKDCPTSKCLFVQV